MLLQNHPDLEVTMYTTSFMRFCHGRYDPVHLRKNYTALLHEAADRIRTRWARELNLAEILNTCDQSRTVTYGLLYDLMMSDLFLRGDSKAWAEKTQLVWRKIPDFIDMMPAPKAIVLIRDPRSVLASFKRITYAPEPAYLGAIFNCLDVMRRGQELKAQFPNTVHVARFEDLLDEPEATLRQMFQAIGLTASHDLTRSDNWLDAHGQPWRHNSGFHQDDGNDEFDREDARERWRRHLSGWEIELAQRVTGEMMAAYGYALADSPSDGVRAEDQISRDPKIAQYYRQWMDTGEGVEEFPTDPLNPANWSENAESD